MADVALEAQIRTVTGKKVKVLRRQDLIPGTVYGPKTKPLSVQFQRRPLEVALMRAGGTQIIDLNIDGKTYAALAKDVQRDVLQGSILHVDWYIIDADTPIRADIPIHLIGESPVVASRQGVLITGLNFLSVEILPRYLVDQIEVDISVLDEIGKQIQVSDLQLDNMTVLSDENEVIAGVVYSSAARAEEAEEAEAEEAAMPSEPEVISKGKSEEEED